MLGSHLERQAELHAPYLRQAAAWLRGRQPEARRVLDVGSGPGVAACLLAQEFPEAEVVAVDGAPELLEMARARADALGLGERLRTLRAELPEGFPALGEADVIWASQVVHHLGDQRAALRAMAGLLRPGGVLAVAERGLPTRFLPRDIGLGRPGFLTRLDAVEEEWFTAMRAGLPGSTDTVEDWPEMLAAAGLTAAPPRSFLVDLPPPLAPGARAHLHTLLARRREELGESLDPDDRATLDVLLSGEDPAGVLRRPDAFYLTAFTVHTGRRAGGDGDAGPASGARPAP
ncbi:class I SAM-dependent methyltransferase [Streptomyces sp. DSM 44917]|uniref:Class I SAM-dependent methyltransferase n=1 Tax=Streptomyces boetiae TaxID=3075541 RepID=A0ABU2LFG3_9ACTN|nr:class I SAM-dependent methyltransferase [Streptomyces sp. DSM 44917]MDT0309997.1 class I SAM-dependent methyltransferase [Streptomyces sp. DSM 44917]